jgi:hypothetical protein
MLFSSLSQQATRFESQMLVHERRDVLSVTGILR